MRATLRILALTLTTAMIACVGDVGGPMDELPDGGQIEEDGGLVEGDGGLVEEDGGLIEEDSGLIEEDGGLIEEDSGLIDEDSGLIEEDADPPCDPLRCADYDDTCGAMSDGCDGTIDCGGCDSGDCVDNRCVARPADCSGIAANPHFELCDSDVDFCAGVYTNGAGCDAFCAAAGMRCVAAYGGEPGCNQEPHNPLGCGGPNGHMSDWCECAGDGGVVIPPDPECTINPSNPPRSFEQGYRSATFSPRSSWVLDCRDYAYTAQYAEHEECDGDYDAGSGRGTATIVFSGVPTGTYDVWVEGRHTTNRNPSGALVIVSSGGATYRERIYQREDAGIERVTHGRYCLSGTVQIVMDSSESGASDSLYAVGLTPR